MYTHPNFPTKKALKEALKLGLTVTVYSHGIGSPPVNGECSVEGPHYPKPHTWYGEVKIVNGVVKSVK